MTAKKPDNRELLRRIATLSSEAPWSPAETREALSEAGVRSEDVVQPIVQLVSRLKKESPFHWRTRADAARRELLAKVQARLGSELSALTRPQLLDRVREGIQRLPAPAAQQYAVSFRKFEEASEDDLRSMLEELAVLAELEGNKD
jgi:hypothetical protein